MVAVGAGAAKQREAKAIKTRRSANFYSHSIDFTPCQRSFSRCRDAFLDVLWVPPLSSMLSGHILCSLLYVLYDRFSTVRILDNVMSRLPHLIYRMRSRLVTAQSFSSFVLFSHVPSGPFS